MVMTAWASLTVAPGYLGSEVTAQVQAMVAMDYAPWAEGATPIAAPAYLLSAETARHKAQKAAAESGPGVALQPKLGVKEAMRYLPNWVLELPQMASQAIFKATSRSPATSRKVEAPS